MVFSASPADRAAAEQRLRAGEAAAAPLISLHECGGWIYQNKDDHTDIICCAAGGGLAGAHDIDLRTPAKPAGDYFVVASYHTHPSPPLDARGEIAGRTPWPSSADLDNAAFNRVPGIVLTWPLNNRDTLRGARIPQPTVATNLVVGGSVAQPDTDRGTVFAYGPERRAGWFEGAKGFPKVSAAGGGSVPAPDIVLRSYDYTLPAGVGTLFDAFVAVMDGR